MLILYSCIQELPPQPSYSSSTNTPSCSAYAFYFDTVDLAVLLAYLLFSKPRRMPAASSRCHHLHCERRTMVGRRLRPSNVNIRIRLRHWTKWFICGKTAFSLFPLSYGRHLDTTGTSNGQLTRCYGPHRPLVDISSFFTASQHHLLQYHPF
jgi:hypothetical protein